MRASHEGLIEAEGTSTEIGYFTLSLSFCVPLEKSTDTNISIILHARLAGGLLK